MKYILRPTNFFLQQLDDVSDEAKELIEAKLRLIKINPFRYKRIVGFGLFLFRIRLEDVNKEIRVNYLVNKPYVNILCITDRDKNYKDLKKYLKKLGYL